MAKHHQQRQDQSLNNSHSLVDDYIKMGAASLQKLRDQGMSLKVGACEEEGGGTGGVCSLMTVPLFHSDLSSCRRCALTCRRSAVGVYSHMHTHTRAPKQNAQRRILDAANALGLSQGTIRWIERRTQEDKYIFWGGVVVTLGVMFFTLRWMWS